jgi:hypothetical protein
MKLLKIMTAMYLGGLICGTAMTLPFGDSFLECLAFGAAWPYVVVRVVIYTSFGV